MGDGLGQLLLGVQVTLAAYHDALSLGRTGAVHGFGTVANGRGAQGQVFDETQDLHAVVTVATPRRYLSMYGPIFSSRRSFSEGAVTIRPPAISSARRTIS